MFWGTEPPAAPDSGDRPDHPGRPRIGRGRDSRPAVSSSTTFCHNPSLKPPRFRPRPSQRAAASSATPTLQHNPLTGGWRLSFKLDPQDAELIELRAVVRRGRRSRRDMALSMDSLISSRAGGSSPPPGRQNAAPRPACRRKRVSPMPPQNLTAFDRATRRAFIDPTRSRSRIWPRVAVLGGAVADHGRRGIRDGPLAGARWAHADRVRSSWCSSPLISAGSR